MIGNPDLVILVSHAEDGNMAEKYAPNQGIKNTARFLNQNGIEIEQAILLNIANENIIVQVDKKQVHFDEYGIANIKADALITKEPNVFLYQKFADCIPLILYDKRQKIVAFAHLGWISTKQNLHLQLVDTFIQHYHSSISDLEVYLGPSIKASSYQMLHPIQLEQEDWNSYLIPSGNDIYGIDLNGYVVNGLKKMGIDDSHIVVSSADTASSPHYFSHYNSSKDDKMKEERFIVGVMRK